MENKAEIKDYASESGHWYDAEGNPRYTMIGANGNERGVTLRDARKDNLFPSVTTVIRVAAAPGLEFWKQQQVLMAALTLPRKDDEPEADWIARIMRDSKETGKKAAERGTRIHGAIEKFFTHGGVDILDMPYAVAARDKVIEFANHNVIWESEKSFCRNGYGCKIDLCSKDGFVVDFKTKEFGPDNLPKAFDEQIMQLAANRLAAGMPNARCANIFISVDNPGLAHLVEHSDEALERGMEMFFNLLSFWMLKNNYRTI